jgi:hypothetical protein
MGYDTNTKSKPKVKLPTKGGKGNLRVEGSFDLKRV